MPNPRRKVSVILKEFFCFLLIKVSDTLRVMNYDFFSYFLLNVYVFDIKNELNILLSL